MDGPRYLESMMQMNKQVFINGERIESYWDHPSLTPALNCILSTYDLAADDHLMPEIHRLIKAQSRLTPKPINRFLHVIQTSDDLMNRIKLQRTLMRYTGGCFGSRCVAGALINPLWKSTWELNHGDPNSPYHDRFKTWLQTAQENDWVVMGCVTDPKGDRSLPPHQQPDPDMYVRIVDKNQEGITINGAKVQQSGAPLAHELLLVPTRAMGPDDADWAVSVAVPADAQGIYYVNDTACSNAKFTAMDPADIGNARYGMHQSTHVLFDHVFVPWERVFLCGEHQVTADLVKRFSDFQRLASCACRCGYIDLCMGAADVMADYNGVPQAAHIKEKLIDMSISTETIHAIIAGAVALSETSESGIVCPETLSVNAAKLYMTDAILKAGQTLYQIAGGICTTRPSSTDLALPQVGELLAKYHKGREGVTVLNRLKMARLAETLSGLSSIIPLLSSMAAGPPATQRLNFKIHTDFNRNREAAKRLAGISDDAP